MQLSRGWPNLPNTLSFLRLGKVRPVGLGLGLRCIVSAWARGQLHAVSHSAPELDPQRSCAAPSPIFCHEVVRALLVLVFLSRSAAAVAPKA